jgi:ABC-2 type transport system permease protein
MTPTNKLSLTFSLARKDWWLFWADRRAAIMCFVVPVLLASAFGLIFNRPSEANAKLPIVVVVEDDGPFTRQVADDLLTSSRFEAREVSRTEAEAEAADRRAVAVMLLSGFEKLKQWQPGTPSERAELQLLHHPNASGERQWAEAVVTEAVMKRVAKEAFGATEQEAAPPFRIEAASVSPHAGFNSFTHSFCGMTLQYLLFWGMESGLLFLRERKRSVWARVRAAGVPLWCVIAGKSLATAWIAFLQVLVTFGVGYLVFDVTIDGSLVGFVLLALAACGLAAATGLLVAALGVTEARARSVSILFILAVSLLGGLWVPAFLLPSWVRDVSVLLPTTWAMRGLETVTWRRGDFFAALPSVAAVTGFAFVLLMIASLRLKFAERRLRQGKA